MFRWCPPVLEVAYPRQTRDRDLYLNGRGLTLVPSYFNWGDPGGRGLGVRRQSAYDGAA